MDSRATAWRSLDVLRAAALVMGLYLALRLLWVAYPLLFVSFLGLLFGLAVARGADFLERFRIPRGLGSALVVFSFVGLLVLIGLWIAPTLREQTGLLRTAMPEAVGRAEDWLDRHALLGQLLREPVAPVPTPTPGTQSSAPATPGRDQAAEAEAAGARTQAGTPAPAEKGGLPRTISGLVGAISGYLMSFLSSTVAVLTGVILILFLSIYIGMEPDLYKRGLLHLVPHRMRGRADEVLTAIGITLRKWLVTQLVAMVVIGVVTTIALTLLGIKAALPLGIIAGLLEFIPMAGPILSGIPAVAMGFLDSPQKALFVTLVYVGIQFFENHFLIPILMKEGVDLPPVLTLIGLAVMGVVFGFLGVLVAVPLLAAVMVAVKLLYVEGVVGDEVETVLDATD
ncbi:MAG TPA: AI-2E family transporter [Thermoanaerobaculia bacterium]|jgi:predicted PurR-regulated permease PerM|nr:AI-2E family transporter [Thermoanaerobaculia bacterium]